MTLAAIWHSVWELVAWWAYWVGEAIGIAFIPIILASRRIPQAKIAWILGVLGFPWIGAFFYLTIGRHTFVRKVLRLRGASARTFADIDRRHGEAGLVSWRRHESQLSKDIAHEAERVGAHGPVSGNRFDLLPEGPEAFAAGAEAIRGAKHHIHLVTYIFKNDPTGRGVLTGLADAARRGVQVRVLYDAIGNVGTQNAFFDPIRRDGGRVEPFLPGGPLRSQFRSNLRNHRKLLVVDGKVAFTGGMNIGDEYATGRDWRDLHCRIEGPVVPTLQRVFAEDWHFATGELLDAEAYYPRPEPAGLVPVQVIESGPDQDDPHADDLMFSALASARRSVDIATPYLVPPEPIEQALRSAARRGRRVRILLGEFVDHRVVRWATDAYIPRLLDAGVQIWRHPKMVHSKAVIIDGSWATMGSINLDARSLRLNFELNVALPDAPTVELLTRWFESELRASRPVEARDLAASFPLRLARQAAYLLSPVL